MAAAPPLDRYLADLRARGIRPGTGPLCAALDRLGHPESAFKSVVVSGTNGKGSATHYLDAVVRAGGVRCGRYLSPHLVRFTERLAVDGAESTAAEWDAAHRDAWDRLGGDPDLTEFEYTTLLAFLMLKAAGVEYAILEVGMGGRLDAVNTVEPELAVITSVGLEHREWLGDTLEKIAVEKAGIIRPGKPVLLGRLPQPAAVAVWEEVERTGALIVDAEAVTAGLELPALQNRAPVQRIAARLALAAARVLLGSRFDAAKALAALATVTVPGRGEVLCLSGICFYLDTAHNPEAAAALAEALGAVPGEKHLLVGLLQDKDAAAYFAALADRFATVTTVTLGGARGRSAAELALYASAAAAEATASGAADPAAAFRAWNAALPAAALRVVAGSHHLVGPVRELLLGGTP